MIRPRQLLLFSLLFFNSVFGDGENNGKSQITEDLKKGNSRTDAEQDPYTSVTLDGGANSTLFATCLAASRTFEARFASIEVVPGSEYIRYVPDSSQLSSPIPWNSVTGNFLSILDCAKAAHDGSWSMFKYNGAKCEVVNTTYNLNDIHDCEENDSDAVFILPAPAPIEDCPKPGFFLGYNDTGTAVYGLVNETLMTFDEAKAYCLGVCPINELTLYVNEHPPLTVQTVISKFTSLGYTNTNLWVDADGEKFNYPGMWHGNFLSIDWWDGTFPIPQFDPLAPHPAAYMDKDAGFKLRVSDKSFKAGALCITFATSDFDYQYEG